MDSLLRKFNLELVDEVWQCCHDFRRSHCQGTGRSAFHRPNRHSRREPSKSISQHQYRGQRKVVRARPCSIRELMCGPRPRPHFADTSQPAAGVANDQSIHAVQPIEQLAGRLRLADDDAFANALYELAYSTENIDGFLSDAAAVVADVLTERTG